MTRTLLAMLFTLSLFFVTGCTSSTETTLIEAEPGAQMTEAEEQAYEDEMDADGEDDGQGDE
ncbi:hypothetical protein N9276_00605 [Rhodopirellula sp.]|nr:hypothetical protein [Rubripirellula sp.]MDB4423059.1 hypothetical protein [Rhodopirellula sp.]MDB4624458.1 hypothetical protein [Rubripirellula sp.]